MGRPTSRGLQTACVRLFALWLSPVGGEEVGASNSEERRSTSQSAYLVFRNSATAVGKCCHSVARVIAAL